MLKAYSTDLHIHTCLSPCAELDLSPREIVNRAKKKHLDIIAVTDHNTAQNARVIMDLGERQGLKVIPGLEVQTKEEIHLLTLFPDWPSAAAWDEEVYRHLPPLANNPEIFGDQPVVDREGNIVKFEERMLLNSLDLSLEEVKLRVAEHGGLTIPSHFNKGSFSLISQLGLIPEELELEALEICRGNLDHNPPGTAAPPSIPTIISSDAHRLEDIGSAYTVFLLAEASLEELRFAFRSQGGRRIVRKVDRGVTVL